MDWITVRRFGRIKYFHLAYAVIIGMPLLAQSYEILLRTLMKVPFDITLTFPFTFKLLYLASICYAIGIALYRYFCPMIIKNYESELGYIDVAQRIYERTYVDRQHEIVFGHLKDESEVKNNLVVLKQKLDSLLCDPTSSSAERNETQNNLNRLIEGLYPTSIQTLLINEFHNARLQYPFAIYTSASFFALGTMLMIFLVIRKTLQLFF